MATGIERKLNATSVIDGLSDLVTLRTVRSFIRSGNGPEFVAQAVRDWSAAAGSNTVDIEPGSRWENGYCEIFYGPQEARIPTEQLTAH